VTQSISPLDDTLIRFDAAAALLAKRESNATSEARTCSPARALPSVQQMISAIALASRTSSSMQGVRISLRQRPGNRDNEHER
tara:strand:+ start:736 stop:984 length:249 start_codon:yes stop_codon:yes gene_type:complete